MEAGLSKDGSVHVTDEFYNTLITFTLALIWSLALLGIATKLLYPGLPKWVTVTIAIVMGWLALLIAEPIYRAIDLQGLAVLILGGLFFTAGGLIFVVERPNPFPGRFGFHEIWHCCVVAGAASHYFVVQLCC